MGAVGPYRRFLLGLTGVTLAGVLALAGALNLLLHRYLVDSTARITQEAVVLHLHQVFPDFLSPHAFHAPNPYGGTWDPDRLYAFVRLHLDLYHIQEATFFREDGTVVLAYERGREGGRATPEEERAMARAQVGPWFREEGVRLGMWLPVPGGFVHLVRDLSPEWALLRPVQAGVLLLALALGLALFLLLRGTYLRAERALAASYEALLVALARALEAKDDETEGHSERVTAYALRLGRALGLRREALEDLRRGALLHDLGKIGIPDAVLRKPGPLTEEEKALMRTHPLIGDRILEGLPALQGARGVVRHHHERFDGRGYPEGLQGEEIPLLARIFAVVDAYDAMTSDRPYRRALSHGEALAAIAREAGKQFDPQVVRVFLRVFAEGREAEDGRRPKEVLVPACPRGRGDAPQG